MSPSQILRNFFFKKCVLIPFPLKEQTVALKKFLMVLSFLKKLCIYFWLYWVFSAAHGLFSSCGSRPLWWFLLLHSTGFTAHGLSSCGALALLPYGMWDLPRPGIKPVSPASQVRFFTNGLPGKPQEQIFFFLSFPGNSD